MQIAHLKIIKNGEITRATLALVPRFYAYALSYISHVRHHQYAHSYIMCMPILVVPSYMEIFGCNNLVSYKVATHKLPQPCDNLVTTLQSCSKVATT